MVKRQDKRFLRELRDKLLFRIQELEHQVDTGEITRERADELLTNEYGSNYFDMLQEASEILTYQRKHDQGIAIAAIVMLAMISPLIFFTGAGTTLTGFAAALFDVPQTIDINQQFSTDIVFIPDLPQSISSLRATGVYIGNSSFTMKLKYPEGEQILLEYSTEPIPQGAIILGQINNTLPTRKATFQGRCMGTCAINSSGPYQLYLEVEGGTLTLQSITFTERLELSISESPEQEVVVEEEIIQVPQPALPDTTTPDVPVITPPDIPAVNQTNETTLPDQAKPPITPPGQEENKTEENNTPITPPNSTGIDPNNNTLTSQLLNNIRAENARRKQQLKEKKIKEAPEEKDLRPFVIQTKPQQVSRGQKYDVPKKKIDIQKEKLDDNVARKVMLLVKENASINITGTKHGNIIVTEIPWGELKNLPIGPEENVEYIDFNEKIVGTIDAVDAVIQSTRARQILQPTGDVGVCVIDSGLNTELPQMSARFVTGKNFIDNNTNVTDSNGHGTSMTDAIVTLAPEAQIYVAKVLDEYGWGISSDVIKAIDWCMQQEISVISMSLGGGEYPSWCDNTLLAQKANEAAARGIFVSAAAGNDANRMMPAPACGSLVTSVAASDSTISDTPWAAASYTNVTDLFAPGVFVSLMNHEGVKSRISGSSVAAAVTSAAAATLILANNLTGQETQTLMRATGVPIATSLGDYPRLDVYRAAMNVTNNLALTQNGTQSGYDEEIIVQAVACGGWCDSGDCNFYCDGQHMCRGFSEYCGGDGECDQTSQGTCSGTENHVCFQGFCWDRCSTSGDQDGGGESSDSCDPDCSGYQCAAAGSCCTSLCRYEPGSTLCSSGSWACGGAGSPNTCRRQKTDYYCNGAGSCNSASTSYQFPSDNQVCHNGAFVTRSTTRYCSTATDCTLGSCSGTQYYRGCVTASNLCKTTNTGAASSSITASANKVLDASCSNIDASSSANSCDSSQDNYASEDACTYEIRYAECDGSGTCDSDSSTNYAVGDATADVPAGNVTNAQSGGSGNPYSALSCSNYCGTSGSASCNGESYEIDRQACGGTGACDGSTTGCSASGDTSNGAACSCDGQCTSSVCDSSVYEGVATSEYCLNDASYCVDNGGTVRASGYDAGTSTCYGSASGGSVWLADDGRYKIQNAATTTLAVIDKYGSMGVRGTATWSTTANDAGYQVKNSSGTLQLTVESTGASGDLEAAGTLTERTTPSGTGVHVNNNVGTVQAVLTSTGNVLLKGDFAYSLSGLA